MHITELKSTLSAITRIKVVTVWRLVEAFSRLGDPAIGVEMVRWAIEHAPAEACEVYSTCLPVHQGAAAWIRSFINWMRASALAVPDIRLAVEPFLHHTCKAPSTQEDAF